MTANSTAVFNYLKAQDAAGNTQVTTDDIVAATGLPKKTVVGVITMSFCRHKDADKNVVPLAERVPVEVELADGTHEKTNLIRLTDAGRAFDPEA